MNSSPNVPAKHPDRVAEPLVGDYVVPTSLPRKRGLSDWVELTEAVEALCPVWPERDTRQGSSKNLL